jgi:arginase family enzyme
VIEQARKIVGDEPTYLTIDSDVLDCSVMPGTTLPEAFGFVGHEVRQIIHGLRGCNIIGADFMELSPNYDPTGMSCCLASSLVQELLCLLAESRARYAPTNRITHWK